jgi:hypothetical protein
MALPLKRSSSKPAFSKEEAQDLLRACFTTFKQRLVEIAHTSLEMASDLFDNNDFVTEKDILEFKTKRSEWPARFTAALDDLFERRLSGVKRKGRRPDFDASLASLRVLTAFDHEKQEALKSSASFLLRFTRRELDALDLRLDLLLDAERADLDNPFGPMYILDAIGVASRAIWPHARVWRPAMERLIADLTPAVNKIYISLNRQLADRNVLPEIKAELRVRSEHRPEDDRDLLPAFGKLLAGVSDVPTNVVVPDSLGDPNAAPAFNFDRAATAWQPPHGAPGVAQGAAPAGVAAGLAAAQNLPPALYMSGSDSAALVAAAKAASVISPEIIAILEALAKLNPPRGADTADAARATADLPTLDPLMALGSAAPLFSTLGKWQRLDLASILAASAPSGASAGTPGGALPVAADGSTGTVIPLNLVPHISSAIAGQMTSPSDKLSVEVIALLFDYVFRDPSIPASLRSLFGRLQVPIVKVALLDRTFFSDREHPARLLLDNLAEAAVGAQNDEAYRASFELAASAAIDQICRDFEIDVSIFDAANATLAEFTDAERVQAATAMKEDVEAALAAEQSDADRSYTRAFVRDRLAGLELPFEIRGFVETTWAEYMARIRRARGEDSKSWIAAVATLDDLLWSIVAKERAGQKARLTRMIPGLIRDLRAGIVAQKVPEERAQKFMEAIYDLHIAAIKAGDATPTAAAKPGPTAESGHVITNVHDYVSEMAPGTWLAFRRGEETVNARLAWVSPMRTKYIFTSRARRRAFVYSPEELAYQLGAGQAALVVEPVPLFDRAVSAAMDALATQVPEHNTGAAAAAVHDAYPSAA